MDRKEELLKIFPTKLRQIMNCLPVDYDGLQEIRMRICGPLVVIYNGREYFVDAAGRMTGVPDSAYCVTEEDIRETVSAVSRYSIYAYEDEIRQGFMTIQGGHRVGIAGKGVIEQGEIRHIRYVSFLNIRLAHQVTGCATDILPSICRGESVCHTLIVSPPGRGKTTLLRDIIRQLSDGTKERPGMNIGVVDERSEIAACYLGIPQNDVGIRTDIMDGCPKAEGMLMMLRSMSPQVIAVDEIGGRKDIEAIEYVMNCGCKLIATVHGSSIDDLKMKPVLRKLVEEKLFERYIVLGCDRAGQVEAVFDAFGSDVFKDNRCRLCH